MFRRYIAVAKKEFLEMKRNSLFFLMTVLAPTMFYFLFAYGFPLDAKRTMIGIVDMDKTTTSRRLIDAFQNATDLFDLTLVTNDSDVADRALARGDIRVSFEIPHSFERKVKAGRAIHLQALIDGGYPNMASLIGANTDAIVSAFNYDVLSHFLLTRPSFEAGGLTFTPIDLTVGGWYNSSFRSEDFIVPAIIALVLVFFPPMLGAISLSREKETGSILNMYCSNLSKAEYLLGKMTPYVMISYLNFILYVALSIYLFDVPMRGSLTTLLFTGFFYTASCLATGLIVAVLVKSQVAAILITFVGTVMPAFLFTGFMVPMSSMDPSAQYMGYCLPTTYFIEILRRLMVKGVAVEYVFTSSLVLIGSCVFLYALSIILFKKRIS